LLETFRQQDPRTDQLLATVWQGFEKALLEELPDTAKVYTTYETVYKRPVFKTFLRRMQYRPVKKVAFVKEVS
jgi:hypothetical protein